MNTHYFFLKIGNSGCTPRAFPDKSTIPSVHPPTFRENREFLRNTHHFSCQSIIFDVHPPSSNTGLRFLFEEKTFLLKENGLRLKELQGFEGEYADRVNRVYFRLSLSGDNFVCRITACH